MRHRGWGILGWISLDRPGTRRTAERNSVPVAVDEMKNLRGVVRVWTRLTHLPSGLLLIVALSSGCGPRAHIPLRPVNFQGALSSADSGAMLARSLAPVLYLQRDERFPLSRVVAVLHPTKRIIAYHLLWRDDVNGSWIPFTVATDQEIVWVGYDESHTPVDVWTYWHGTILHTPWNRSQVAINVQWGKHGSLPRGLVESSLPAPKKLNFFYAATKFLIPDQLLSRAMRGGPATFPGGYDRYRDFSREMTTGDRLDAIARLEDPDDFLRAVFGKYSKKPPWPRGI